jgi:hypothetical protein
MEGFMSEFSQVHPVEAEEITPFGIWLLTRITIAAAAVLVVSPFVLYHAN